MLRTAPQPLRDFFNNLEDPAWLDYEAFRPGIRAFHANVDLMLVAFVTGVLVEGFSTMIAKSFNITGRVASTKRRRPSGGSSRTTAICWIYSFQAVCTETAMDGSCPRGSGLSTAE